MPYTKSASVTNIMRSQAVERSALPGRSARNGTAYTRQGAQACIGSAVRGPILLRLSEYRQYPPLPYPYSHAARLPGFHGIRAAAPTCSTRSRSDIEYPPPLHSRTLRARVCVCGRVCVCVCVPWATRHAACRGPQHIDSGGARRRPESAHEVRACVRVFARARMCERGTSASAASSRRGGRGKA